MMNKRNQFNLRYANKGRWKKEKKKMLHTFRVIESIHEVRKLENPVEVDLPDLDNEIIEHLEIEAHKYGCTTNELASAYLILALKDKPI